ncbi:MAG: type II toxin-antitoxin system VapC family toxin [Phycisphaerales bacterium]|nr:type II toxin-antitoxin system VapC family toxin [Phycisphaerales bacterium]MCI0630859.1 type II toxin-antitoxin system VapC family toxin [Phycisphaerales bacterium]MCI0674671.1 type II toxin-antitoxin system VapC family toxin [Phycisphaerales bacterium]
MALRIAFDVNRYSDLARGVEPVVEAFESAHEVWMPFVVLAELRVGFRRGTRQDQNERLLQTFLKEQGVAVLLADEATTHVYAELHTALRQRGTPIPTNDLWIAALVIQHDLVLLTRDEHFRVVPRLRLM